MFETLTATSLSIQPLTEAFVVIVTLNNECCMMGMGVEYVGDAGDLSISCESSLPLYASSALCDTWSCSPNRAF